LAERFWDGKETGENPVGKIGEKAVKRAPAGEPKQKMGLNAENVRDGLAQLVLTVVELLREVMEKQAIRRMEAGSLEEEQIEELGLTFQRLKGEVARLRGYFGLKEEDLNLDLGPLGRLRQQPDAAAMSKEFTLVELLDRVFDKGIAVRGDIVISVADVDLVVVNLALLIASMETAMKIYESESDREVKQKISELEERIERLKSQKKELEKIAVKARGKK